MKPLLWVALCLCFLLVGCELVFQAGTGRGAGFEDYLKSIKPYGEYWVKDGMTVEGRREDSWGCGAVRTVDGANYVIFSDEQEKAERRAQEKDNFAARERLSRAWVECMKARGYRYAK